MKNQLKKETRNIIGYGIKSIIFISLITNIMLLNLANAATIKNKQPNFVWLLSEDNGAEYVKLFNKNGAAMPNIEKLAKRGLIFTHAFSNSPVCSTARTTLATGAYGAKIATQHHRGYKHAILPESLKPISALLKDAGYFTSNDVKTDFNFTEKNPTWSKSARNASWRDRADNQPFFHMQTWGTTHESSLHFPFSDIKNKPTQHDPKTVSVAPIYPDTELFRYTYARYLDNHQKVDKQIGEVIQKLEDDGLLENTFIFYFGDHGGALPGSKGYVSERGLHIPLVVRVPENYKHLLPTELQNPVNKRVNGYVSFIDFAPTLLSLAGLGENKHHDGKAFLNKNVTLDKLNARDTSFSFADRFDEKYDLVRAIRKGKYKYIRHFQPFNPDSLFNFYRYKQQAFKQWRQYFLEDRLPVEQASFFEAKPLEGLYDIEQDPYEMNNLTDDETYAETLGSLRSALTNQLKSMPDLSFYPEYWQNEFAADNSVIFAQTYKNEIAQLIDIANLSLQPFDEVKEQLKVALLSKNQWQRYWGLIAAASFGKDALVFKTTLERMASDDINNLNRGRAIQALAILSNYNPIQALEKVIGNTQNTMEVLQLLNMATQLHDTQGYKFTIPIRASWYKPENSEKNAHHQRNVHYWFTNRINYLKQ